MTELAPTLEAACERWPDRPAVTYHGRTISYGQLWDGVSSLTRAYERMGVGRGDRLVCQLPNCPEHVMAMNAAWQRGAIHAGTDNDLTGPELAWLVGHLEATTLLLQPRTGSGGPDAVVRAVHQARPRTTVIVKGTRPEAHGHYSLEALLGQDLGLGERAPRPEPAGDEPSLLLLTSGTTGKAKGVLESLANCWAKMQFFADAFGPGPDDVHLLFLPMGHVFGLRLSLLPLLTGGRLVLLDRFSPEAALRLVVEERVTVLPGMPAHFRLLLSALDTDRHDVSSLRWGITAAAALPPSLSEPMYERLGLDILYVYGCSEGFTILTTDRREISAGSVGKRVFVGPQGTAPNGTVAIRDPEDLTFLARGEVGEISFGASRAVRYWREPEVATDGWYRTGDLGWMDDEGCVYIVGRRKELVNRGGLKVAPGEVEVAVAAHPGVADAAVIATPDPVLGEAICACVVPVPDGAGPPELADLRAFLAESLARHKLPDELCLVESIPRTKIGKVDRGALRAAVVGLDRPRQRLRAG